MKPLILILLGIFATSASFADSFTVIQNGQEYLCTSTGNNPSDPNQARACVDRAYSGVFSRDESFRICEGARNTAPADCAISAYAGVFTREESIQLCVGAIQPGPAECAKSAYAGVFTRDESLRLCTRTGAAETAECAKSAYAGPYSREEAIQLCRQNSRLLLRSLKLIEQSPDAQRRIQLLKK